MSAKRWVGGWSEKFLLIFSTIYADVDVGGWVGDSRKGQKYADVIYGRYLGLASVPTA